LKIPVEFNALGELPEGWSWQPLQSLTANPKQDVVDGPFGSDLKASEYVSTGVPIARLQNIDRNTFVTKNIRFLTPEKAADLVRHEFRPDDILITKLGDPLGKACIVPTSIGRGVIVADLVRVRPDDKLVDRRYLTYAINSPTLVKQFELHTKGTTRPRVNLSVLRQLPIPLAPRAAQDEIVADIEKQFSRLDEAVANLQRVKANLKRYKASVLKDAVEGRLVPAEAELARREGRSFETGEQLLQRILEARRSNWTGRGKFKTPAAPETMGLMELPSAWAWATVEQLANVISGLTKNPARETLPLKLPYLRVANVYANELRLDEMAEIGVTDNELQKLLVLKNDLLVVEGNGSPDQIGRVAKWDGSIAPCVHQNHLIKVRAVVAEPDWVLNWLVSPGGRKQIELVSSSTTGLHTLSTGKVGRLPVPLPPVAEQQRIVLEVDRRLSLIRGVEVEVDANLKRSQALRQSTLSKAFSF
jgi:type I restriction enzyme S subunit